MVPAPVETKLSACVPVNVPAMVVLRATVMPLALVPAAARLVMLPADVKPAAVAPRVTFKPSVKTSGELLVMLMPVEGEAPPTRAATVTVGVLTTALASR